MTTLSLCVFYEDFSLWNIFIFILGLFSLKIFSLFIKKKIITIQSPSFERKKKKSLENMGGESKVSVGHILKTKIVDLGVNKFYLMKGVLLKCF